MSIYLNNSHYRHQQIYIYSSNCYCSNRGHSDSFQKGTQGLLIVSPTQRCSQNREKQPYCVGKVPSIPLYMKDIRTGRLVMFCVLIKPPCFPGLSMLPADDLRFRILPTSLNSDGRVGHLLCYMVYRAHIITFAEWSIT